MINHQRRRSQPQKRFSTAVGCPAQNSPQPSPLQCLHGFTPMNTPTDTSESPESQPPARKRVRRWHHRGFTGCSTCRRRHVRCDEASPACKNCSRLGLECDGTQGRMTFKVYGPSQTQEPAKAPRKRKTGLDTDDIPGTGVLSIKQEEPDGPGCEGIVVSPTTVAQSPAHFRFQEPIAPPNLVSTTLQSADERYYTHFIDQVSTLLLIYDNSTNLNPYRIHFPDFARSSPSMVGIMQALGALHLANTSVGPQRNRHFQQAMGKYGDAVQLFRARYVQPSQQLGMTDFATCLLLCLFEMMDSQHQNWAVHLKGAREIYNLLFYPHTGNSPREVQRVAESNHPLRSFLVSLLSYLDVAGACATPGGTVVEGNYWKTLGGGWEYNLGTPSLSSPSMPDDPRLVELRQAWSGMMEVQAAISTFARDKQWMSPDYQDVVYKDIFNRLVVWRASTPISLQLLGDMELDDESLRRFPFPDVLEYVGCIEAYEKATFVHLHQVAGAGRYMWISDRAYLDMLITRILTLIRKLSKDVGQLAVLWPLFIAGQETRDETEQKYVRETMEDLKRFGFRNVEKGLELLEKVWFKRRAFPDGWTETLDEIQSNILLP
ncbi:transcriptional regulator family: Fungal Specific TF [Penicillium capsulatum]|uniref:Transcriptional regulator family: Fungal Specific TF n=1 Tax=Penicillium capsulatum TaxID=69766 RepID=A0A9W9INZ5_9EURO|nr:transcriptional regulator family: Fungal Specific TF [Penicillium capsulatum]KAJ6130799.1 transcriptional regulator family: Fungal Specific TF [Penicillium capsulatum]